VKKKTAALRYAKALLLLAQPKNKTDEYAEELGRFLDVFRRDGEIRGVLLSPIFDAAERKRIACHVVDRLGLCGVVKNFLQILIDKERMGELENIVGAYREMADETGGRVRIALRSATTIPPDLFDKIREQMQGMLKKEAILEVEVQPELIGGLVAKIRDVQIDGSVKNQILKLRETLESALGVA